jgi:hypothetical protein
VHIPGLVATLSAGKDGSVPIGSDGDLRLH